MQFICFLIFILNVANNLDRIPLSVYNTNSEGDVFSVLSNYSDPVYQPTRAFDPSMDPLPSSPRKSTDGSDVVVVGAFDTTFRTSQVTYCSGMIFVILNIQIF